MTVQDRLQVPPAGDAPSVRPPARTLGAPPKLPPPSLPNVYVQKGGLGGGGVTIRVPEPLPRVTLRRLSRGTWRVSYLAVSGREHVIGRYQNHATAQQQARAYARVQDCPVEEVAS